MAAAGHGYAVLEKPIQGNERNHIVGVVKQVGGDPGLVQDLRRICTPAREDRRNRRRAAHADGRPVGVPYCRKLPRGWYGLSPFVHVKY